MDTLLYQRLDKNSSSYSNFSTEEQRKIRQHLEKLEFSNIPIDDFTFFVAASNLFLSWKWAKYFKIEKGVIPFYPESLDMEGCQKLDETSKQRALFLEKNKHLKATKEAEGETCDAYTLTPNDNTTYYYTEGNTTMAALPTLSEYQFFTVKMIFDEDKLESTLSPIVQEDLKTLFSPKNRRRVKVTLPEMFEELEIDCRKLFPKDPYLSGNAPFAFGKNGMPVDLVLFRQNIKMDINSVGGEIKVKQISMARARGIGRKEEVLPEFVVNHPITYQLTCFTTFDHNFKHAYPICQGFETGTLSELKIKEKSSVKVVEKEPILLFEGNDEGGEEF
jgi:hypothetical protein